MYDDTTFINLHDAVTRHYANPRPGTKTVNVGKLAKITRWYDGQCTDFTVTIDNIDIVFYLSIEYPRRDTEFLRVEVAVGATDFSTDYTENSPDEPVSHTIDLIELLKATIVEAE